MALLWKGFFCHTSCPPKPAHFFCGQYLLHRLSCHQGAGIPSKPSCEHCVCKRERGGGVWGGAPCAPLPCQAAQNLLYTNEDARICIISTNIIRASGLQISAAQVCFKALCFHEESARKIPEFQEHCLCNEVRALCLQAQVGG